MNDRTANLLGALAQLAVDRQLASIEAASGINGTSAAALVTLANAPGEGIDFLYKTLGRSQSATTRLVAKLEAGSLLERVAGDDGRASPLVLTRQGELAVAEILDARHQALASCLSYLTADEQSDFDILLAKILASTVIDEQHAYQICRLCDGDECDICPVEEALEGA